MSKQKLVKWIKRLRRAGESFRAIEARFPRALGAGNGTKAYRLLKAALRARKINVRGEAKRGMIVPVSVNPVTRAPATTPGAEQEQKMTLKQIREAFRADTYSLKNGVFIVRRGFFYSGGFSAEAYAAKVKAAFPTATILDSGEVWKAFRGGATVAQQSHWFVKFSFAPVSAS